MNDFEFEQSPWEAYLDTIKAGSIVSAASLLSMLENEEDDIFDDVFEVLNEKEISVDISSLMKPTALGQAAIRLKQEESFVRSGMNLRDLDLSDPLRMYLEEVAGIPAFGDEQLLIQHYISGNQDSAIALTNLGLGRVIQLAGAYVGYGVLLLDLIQEGSIGLWQAIQTYVKGDYTSHRDRMIQNALAKTIILQSRNNGIGQKMREAMQDYRNAEEKLLIEYGRNPSLEEIALEIHMSREEAEIVKKMMDDAFLLQQAENAAKPKEEETPEDSMAVEDTAYFQMRQRINELLSELNEQDAKLLTLRFGLEKGLPMSAEETGRLLGMTTNEVTSREAAALAKLRQFQ